MTPRRAHDLVGWCLRRPVRAVLLAYAASRVVVIVALLVATGWILATGSNYAVRDWPLWLVTAVTALIVWRTRVHLLWLLGAGALLGWFGLV